jgi:presequence protease
MPFTPGTSCSGFILKKSAVIDEIKSEVFLFEHELLGCPLLAIKNDDPNKTFAAAFNTIPTDSTGVAHILEHSVLMGSKKYPVKDVFGEVNKGGLMTFLNAMTGSDITYYPFATRNLKEYFNLMDIYCDVVFSPLLKRTTFEQEGWHYHQESPDAQLRFQGVVYNEMKGAFSDPIRLIFHHIFGGLMPGSTYAHESGGDPKNIPDLAYEQFCDFHRRHYHPSNGIFFVYGDAPLADELDYLQSRFLAQFTHREDRRQIEPGTLITSPVFVSDTYAVEQNNTVEKTFLAVGTSVSDVLDREKNAAFQIIANILYNSDASPLKNAIISSGLCKDFGGFYLSSSSFKTFMVTYLVGSEADRRDNFLNLYTTTLKTMAEQGLDHDLVLSELNKYEFSVREEASKAQRGLDLIGKAMVAFKYGTDPFDNLVNEELFHTIRQKALDTRYFEDLIHTYLLDNQATVVVTLTPDEQKLSQGQKEEQQRLENFARTLAPAERETLIARTNELQRLQQTPNDIETLALLPQLTLSDLSADINLHAVRPTEMFASQVLVSELVTNHISYLDIGFDFSCLPARLLPWLDLFGTIVTEIGTEKMNYIRFAKEIATCTGGFSHSLITYGKRKAPDKVKPVLWLHLKCLPEYLKQALHLIAEIFSDISFKDRARIREIVAREFAWDEHSAQSEGYNLPMMRVFSHLSAAGRYNELISGASCYLRIKELAKSYDSLEESFLASLKEIAGLLFNRNNLILAVTGEAEEIAEINDIGGCIVDALAATPVTKQEIGPLDLPDHEAFITSSEVAFVAQGGSLLTNGSGYNGHFEVLKTYLSRDYLWNTVRQMGGAYGCFIQFSHITGNLAIVSYRDPQVRKTYEAYSRIPEIITGLDLPNKVLEQIIIGTYGNFDPHQSPAAKGAAARNEYLSGIDIEYKRQRLKEIVSTTVDDLKAFAPTFEQMKGYRAAIGNRSKIETDKDLFDKLTEL